MEKNPADYIKESWATRLGQTCKSVVKLIVQSRRTDFGDNAAGNHDKPIIIMGNGPSLAETIRDYGEILRTSDTMAVNFAANAPEFRELKPKYYILADPHFFDNPNDPNVAKLIANLKSVDWPMTILLPFGAKTSGWKSEGGSNLKISFYNAVGIEGFRWFTDWCYTHRLGMPRPRNVLIPAIMTAIGLGYRQIYITGADHSWTKTLSVDDDNNVLSVQPHFYKEDEKEVARIRKEYLKHPLHAILYSFYLAFRSYYVIEDYARRHNIKIYNATPGSFIDAFSRRSLSEIASDNK